MLLAVVYRSFTRGDWREESHVDFPVVAEGLPCTYRERWDLLFAVVEGWKGSVKPAGEPVKAAVRVLEVSAPSLRPGSWGRLRVKVGAGGMVLVSVEGDVKCLLADRQVEGEGVVEVAVKPKTAGEVPVKVVVALNIFEDALQRASELGMATDYGRVLKSKE
ncbi:hypothetical protein [Infirmifilum sp.]|uniref:hypothetical protein n=1 Tax=Infirmifilum sp. TaxID=2856575 RepID=UPI003D138E9C